MLNLDDHTLCTKSFTFTLSDDYIIIAHQGHIFSDGTLSLQCKCIVHNHIYYNNHSYHLKGSI